MTLFTRFIYYGLPLIAVYLFFAYMIKRELDKDKDK